MHRPHVLTGYLLLFQPHQPFSFHANRKRKYTSLRRTKAWELNTLSWDGWHLCLVTIGKPITLVRRMECTDPMLVDSHMQSACLKNATSENGAKVPTRQGEKAGGQSNKCPLFCLRLWLIVWLLSLPMQTAPSAGKHSACFPITEWLAW